jgi:hypothetical protein
VYRGQFEHQEFSSLIVLLTVVPLPVRCEDFKLVKRRINHKPWQIGTIPH